MSGMEVLLGSSRRIRYAMDTRSNPVRQHFHRPSRLQGRCENRLDLDHYQGVPPLATGVQKLILRQGSITPSSWVLVVPWMVAWGRSGRESNSTENPTAKSRPQH